MRLLLDTHAVIWWFQGNLRMSQAARDAVDDEGADVFVSAVSAFEIALKHHLGKLPEGAALTANMEEMVLSQGFTPLDVTLRHALIAGGLRFAHRDPFDRLLVSQALEEDLVLVSNERLFDGTGVRRIW